MGRYEQAQVCPNGHVATAHYRTHSQFRQSFCPTCGEPTITQCPNCNAPIQGAYVAEGIISATSYTPPAYCHNCGAPFPWTERKLAAIAQAVEASELTAEEQQEFQDAAAEVINRTPQAEGAAQKIKKLLAKAGQGLAQATRDILVDVASEAVKKQLGF